MRLVGPVEAIRSGRTVPATRPPASEDMEKSAVIGSEYLGKTFYTFDAYTGILNPAYISGPRELFMESTYPAVQRVGSEGS